MNVLRCRSASMLADGGDVGTDKVMQKYARHFKEKKTITGHLVGVLT